MPVAWIKGYDPNKIAERMEAIKSIDQQGRVTFNVFEHLEQIALLCSMVQLGAEIPELEKRRIINQATVEAGKSGKITVQAISEAINELEKKYYRCPAKKYQIITTLSVNHFQTIKQAVVHNCSIRFTSHLPVSLLESRNKLLDRARHALTGELPKNYIYVKIGVSAKSDAEAANRALDAIDLLRGIWNLFFNRGQYFRISSGKRAPVNRLVLGPVHTLHKPSGKLASESWWYQAEYRGPIGSYDLRNKIDKMYAYTSDVRKALKRSRYAKDIETSILRYVRALDLIDWEDAFLRLWGALEQLTNTVSESYKVTVRRASFLFEDREYHRQILSHLRDYRNRAIHAGTENYDIEAYMYQLKRYVEEVIGFHLGNRFGFDNLAHAAQFMDLPDNSISLDRQIKMIRYAKKYLGYD